VLPPAAGKYLLPSHHLHGPRWQTGAYTYKHEKQEARHGGLDRDSVHSCSIKRRLQYTEVHGVCQEHRGPGRTA